MNMKNRLFLTVFLALCFCIFSASDFLAQEQQRTLPVTFDWMKTRADYVGSISSKVPRDKAMYQSLMKQARDWELVSYNGCTVVWKSKIRNPYDKESQMTLTFSFADLDPQKLRTQSKGDGGQYTDIWLYATDEKRIVNWQFIITQTTMDYGNWKTTITGKPRKKIKTTTEMIQTNSVNLQVGNHMNMGQRFTDAINNALTLCGGKPSKKEPF